MSLTRFLKCPVDEEIIYNFEKCKEKYPKDTKIHVIFRNPVERAYSDYQRLKSWYEKKKLPIYNFEDAIMKDPLNIIEAGDYLKWIIPIVEYYDKVFIYDLEEMSRISDFPKVNINKYEQMKQSTRIWLEKYYNTRFANFKSWLKSRSTITITEL